MRTGRRAILPRIFIVRSKPGHDALYDDATHAVAPVVGVAVDTAPILLDRLAEALAISRARDQFHRPRLIQLYRDPPQGPLVRGRTLQLRSAPRLTSVSARLEL